MRFCITGLFRRATLLLSFSWGFSIQSQSAHAFTLNEPAAGSAITVKNASKMRFSGTCDESDEEIRVSFVAKRIKGLDDATKHRTAKCVEVAVGRKKDSSGKRATARVWSTTMDLSNLPEGRVSIFVSSGERIRGVNLVKDVAPTMVSVSSFAGPKAGARRLSAEGNCSKNGQPVALSIDGSQGPGLSTVCTDNAWSFENVDLSEIDKDEVEVEVRHVNELTGESDVTGFSLVLPEQNKDAAGATLEHVPSKVAAKR